MKKHLLAAFLLLSSFFGFSQAGAALRFDGINDYVSLPNVNTPFNVSSLHIKTFQVWFRNTSMQGVDVRIFSTGTANWTSGIWIGYAASSTSLRFELSDGAGPAGVAITGTASIRADNLWHQATGVINGTVATLYLDGTSQGTVNISGEGAMNAQSSVHIGSSYDNETGSYFQGYIDELRVWDRALCANEIMATKNCELTGSESGLVAYYQFNQGIASGNNAGITNLPDLTVNANNGTLTNFTLTGATSNWASPGGVTTGSMCPALSPTICSLQTDVKDLTENDALIKILSSANQYEIVSIEYDIHEIDIFEITGKLIFNKIDLHQNSFSFDLNSQSKGLYFIKVKLDNNQSKTFKVVNQ